MKEPVYQLGEGDLPESLIERCREQAEVLNNLALDGEMLRELMAFHTSMLMDVCRRRGFSLDEFRNSLINISRLYEESLKLAKAVKSGGSRA